MSKGKRQKDYERSGQELGSGHYTRNVPPKLSKKDIMRKMILDNNGKR